jgi:hypothetical protein
MAKKQQNKTTKHTIEFSNNTRKQATLPLYSAAQAPSTPLTTPRTDRHRSLCRGYSTLSISAPRLARFSTNSG